MYPIVEFLTGVLFVLTYYSFGLTLPTFKFLIFGLPADYFDRHGYRGAHSAGCDELVRLRVGAGFRDACASRWLL